MGATPSNTRQKEFVAEIQGWPGFVERMCMTSSDVSGIATAFRKATESSEGKYLQRADFEHWLDMGSKPKPVEERLFEVFIINSGEQQDDALARGLLAERVGVDPMQPTEWKDFCRSYPNLLHPIYKLQRTLQDMTIGKKRWAKLNEKMKLRAAKMGSWRLRRLPMEGMEIWCQALP
ncbi:expressed unknown protein [Ectocarpus siliculosus]|uniref:Uncharacterized protein n=1 Tax=Ectocarpus siliculosus TaxID=2880 RepID=D7G4U3_ECTSI|nr:expressed unknown protein [Ectocarpus siliculosus]|eukprot:CBJ27186.1 expressed unknown protein [Ectocarpus siliculosus]